jgi:hypothetical protein
MVAEKRVEDIVVLRGEKAMKHGKGFSVWFVLDLRFSRVRANLYLYAGL